MELKTNAASMLYGAIEHFGGDIPVLSIQRMLETTYGIDGPLGEDTLADLSAIASDLESRASNKQSEYRCIIRNYRPELERFKKSLNRKRTFLRVLEFVFPITVFAILIACCISDGDWWKLVLVFPILMIVLLGEVVLEACRNYYRKTLSDRDSLIYAYNTEVLSAKSNSVATKLNNRIPEYPKEIDSMYACAEVIQDFIRGRD